MVSSRMARRLGATVLAAAAMAMLAGCAGAARWTDFTSVSVGKTNNGRLHRPVYLPARGSGYVVPENWRDRRNQYGTTELVGLIERSAAQVKSRHRKAKLGVADLSRKRGGKTAWHGSHHSGRDVDLIFYSKNAKGRSLAPPSEQMVHYDGKGKPFIPKHMEETGYRQEDWEERRFDTAKNWALVEALLSDSSARIQWIFVSRPIKNLLLSHARKKDRPKWLIEYAEAVMHQPGGKSSPHDDHFHVRVYCSRSDRALGCVDSGPVWAHEKKTHKYLGPERYDPALWQAIVALPLFFPHA